MSQRILLDLDEVLCDFTGGMLAVHGWTRKEVEAVREPGVWSLAEPMGMTLGDWWKPINDRGELFWTSLEPLPWFADLMMLIEGMTDNWGIVTTPGLDPSGFSGKVKWLRAHFGERFTRFVMTYDKTLLATRNVLLIDDREETVRAFIEAGGDGIIFPSPGNSLHYLADDPVGYLRRILKEERTNAPSL